MIQGLGTDIQDIGRFNKIMANPRFLRRIFSEYEQDYCTRKPFPAQHFAARFGVKEAYYKATHHLYDARITDVQIVNLDRRPQLMLWKIREGLEEKWRTYKMHVSISHTKTYAVATVVVEGQ